MRQRQPGQRLWYARGELPERQAERIKRGSATGARRMSFVHGYLRERESDRRMRYPEASST